MKLTSLLLLTAILQVSAHTRAQTVTYSAKDVPLTTIFSVIKKQTGYLFFYRKEDLAGSSPVTLDLKSVPLQEALKEVLAGQPLAFAIQGNTVFITLKPAAPAAAPVGPVDAPKPVDSIHGRILDSLGVPLAGASVMVKGSKRGTVTNAMGEFTLRGVDPSTVTLVVSFTGFTTREYKVKEPNYFFVRMSRSNDPLDDVQVVAYGTNTRRFSVGSVSTVTSEDIAKQPVSNVLLALEGRVPGLIVSPSSGAPGAYSPIQVRGQNTLISNLGASINGQTLIKNTNGTSQVPFDQPMIIIDGVPLAPGNQNISVLSSLAGYNLLSPNSGISSMGGLNPSDVESISVLKDADATSIYGSQGANGVIVITTKKGKPGKTDFSVKVNTGPNKVTRTIPLLTTPQYLQMRREAAANDNLPVTNVQNFPDILVFDTTRQVDWFHRFLGGTANSTDAYASLSGGTTNSSFLLSGGYTRSAYNYPGNFKDERVTVHSGFHYASSDRRLNVDFGTDFSYDNNISPNAPPSGAAAMLTPPDVPELMDPAGKLVWQYKGIDITNFQPYAYLKQPSSIKTYNLSGSMRVSYQLARGLNLAANLGYSRVNTKQVQQSPLTSLDPAFYTTASANFANTDYQSVNIEPQLDYRTNIGRGAFSALVGGTYKNNVSSGTTVSGTGYVNDALLGSIDPATAVTAYDGYNIYKYAGVFGRLGYVYDREYIISVTGRRDGSSNFGPGRQFGNFGSVGLGWIFSEEQAFQRLLPFVSYAKIAGNYGSNGSDGVAPYNFQDYWKVQSQFLPTFQGTRGYVPLNAYNPNYSWASKRSINLSLDLGFIHDRILANFTVYRARTGNQLTTYPLPWQTGFANVVENLNATVQDQGIEVTLSSVNIKTTKFRWTTTFNIAANRNKLISFPGLENSSYASTYTIGKPVSQIYGFKYTGINDTTGIFQFASSKGGNTSTPAYTPVSKGGDMQYINDGAPRFSGGFGNTFTYAGFSLTAFFHFADQTGRNYLFGIYSGTTPGTMENLPSLALDHWRKSGDNAPMQRLTTGLGALGGKAQRAASNFLTSSGAYSDASYIRLQTLSLSYALPEAYLKKAHMKGAMIYVNAQNVFTITGYKVGDPELPGFVYGVPLQRTFMGGVSFNF